MIRPSQAIRSSCPASATTRRRASRLLTFCLGVLASVLFTSCRTPNGPFAAPVPETTRLGPNAHPVIGIVYYPYGWEEGTAGARVAMPHPRQYGWTGSRMARDLDRLAWTGADLVVVDLPRERWRQEPRELAEGMQRFLDQADAMDVTVVLRHVGPLPAGLLDWCARLGLHEHGSYLKRNGKPLVVVRDAAGVRPHIGLSIMRVEPVGGVSLPALPELAGKLQLDRSQSWLVYRNPPDGDAERLGRELATAARLGTAYLIVESWNDFASGTFVEPNTADVEALMRAAREALTRVAPSP